MTTLDSATRLLRYNIEEIGASTGILPLKNRFVAATLAVLAIAFFAFMKFGGKPAGLILWGLFGTSNQLLGGIALLLGTLYLYQNQKPLFYTLLPMAFLLSVTLFAMGINWWKFWKQHNMPLVLVGGAILVLTLWLIFEAAVSVSITRRKQVQQGE